MKLPVLAVVAAAVLTLGTGIWFTARPAEAAVDNLNITQTCTRDGRLTAKFVWDGSSQFIVQQWLDLSLQDNHWEPGTFLGNGPMPASQSTLTWTGLQQGARHFVRINQWYSGATAGAGADWQPSATFYFDTGFCTPGASGVGGVILPSGGTGSTLPPLEPDRRRIQAPIEDAKVLPGSQPGTFVVQAKVGLPGGCARQGGYEVTQQGPNLITVITVTIYDTVPAIQDMACTQVYGLYDVTANLGLLTVDHQYEIHVNDKTVPFAMP